MTLLDERRLHWLAGLLEGEASFRLTRPNRRNGPQPMIDLVMKDQDVVQQAADIFQVAVTTIPPRNMDWHTTYLARLRGARAHFLMQILHPLMGQRRQAQIDAVLSGYVFVPDHRGSHNEAAKLSEPQVRVIKRRLAQGEMPRSIAEDFEVSLYAIRAIRSGKTWAHVPAEGEVSPDSAAGENPFQIIPFPSSEENALHWLAGLLEGEGSFLFPTPSAPGRPVIQLAMTDEDVVARVAALFSVRYHGWQRRNSNAKLSYQVLLRGGRAVDYMQRLRPLMGQRRQQQIDQALAQYTPPDRRGDHNPRSRLNREQVVAIKTRLQNGEHHAAIAADFDVSPYTILDIKLGRTWRHVLP